MNRPGADFGLSLLNLGGLPPFTGFVWKVKALRRTTLKLARGMLLGRGLALVSYSRLLLNHGDARSGVSLLVVRTMVVGIV